MWGLKRTISGLATLLLASASLLAFSTPAQAASATAGTGSTISTFTAPTQPAHPSISNAQFRSFAYPGGVFEVGAPSLGSSSIVVNAYKDGALDTSFNTTGSLTFTSQLITSDRTNLKMTTYASGTKWAILDLNSYTNTGYNYLYLGTFAGGYQSTITLPTTSSNYTTCTNKLNAISNGTFTSYSGEFNLVPNTGFAAPLLSIGCSTFVTANGMTYSSNVDFLVNYSGGTTLGTPATFTAFGTNAAAPVHLLNTSTKKTITSFGVSVNPAATGTQIALTYLYATTDGTSYPDPGDYDTTNYTDYFVVRVQANGALTTTTASAWTGAMAGTRSGRVYLTPRNNGTVYAFQHATDGTLVVAKVLTFGATGAASAQTTITGATLTASINRTVVMSSQGTTLKFGSLNNGSASFYFHIDATTAVATQVATFTTSGGFSYADLLWSSADTATGADFYARAGTTSMVKVTAQPGPTAPSYPISIGVTRGNQELLVSWTATSDGGSAITGYSIQVTSNGGTSWTTYAVNSNVTSTLITGLTNGLTYQARVAAVNAVGTSSWSVSSSGAIPAEVPARPVVTSVVYAGPTSVTVSWNAPNDGGHPILDYELDYSSDGGANWNSYASSNTPTATSRVAPALNSGATYVFRVVATNSVGSSLGSAASTAYFVADLPGTPAAPTATVGNAQTTLTWVAPAANGCAITAYRIDYSSDNAVTWNNYSMTTTGTSATITGLVNGVAYRFKIAAQNCDGWGAFSAASAAATPSDVPAVATGLTVTGGVGSQQLTLTWTAVSSASAVTDYRVEYSTNGGSSWTTYADGVSTSNSASITGLTTGLSYSFRVSAINSIGVGSATSVTTAIVAATVPATIAAAPTVTTSFGTALVIWGVPANGGSALTTAELQYSTNGGTSWTTYSGTVDLTGAISVSGLTGGQAYMFRARTNNFFGPSAWSPTSASVTVLAATAPATITSVTSIAGATAGTVDLTWTAPAANGSAITDYQVEYSSDGGVTWTTFVHSPSTANSITVTGLTAGTQYQFRVKAVNGVGGATASAGTNPVAATSAPAASTIDVNAFIGSLKAGATVNAADGKLSITGENMNLVTKILLNSIEAPIITRSALSITVAIPATVLGWVDVEFLTVGGNIRFQDFVYISNAKSAQLVRLGLGYETVAGKISVKNFKSNSVVRLAVATPKFKDATMATCIGYVGKNMSQREAMARAKDSCDQIALRNPAIKVQLALSKKSLRAHVLVLFKY